MKFGIGITEEELDRIDKELNEKFDSQRVKHLNIINKHRGSYKSSNAFMEKHFFATVNSTQKLVQNTPGKYPKTEAWLKNFKKIGD